MIYGYPRTSVSVWLLPLYSDVTRDALIGRVCVCVCRCLSLRRARSTSETRSEWSRSSAVSLKVERRNCRYRDTQTHIQRPQHEPDQCLWLLIIRSRSVFIFICDSLFCSSDHHRLRHDVKQVCCQWKTLPNMS